MFGFDDAAGAIAGTIGKVIDKVFPDPMQAAQAKALLEAQEFAPLLEQIKINLQEAASTNPFVAGWRPFIGWVCGTAFAYKFVGQPLLIFILLNFNPDYPVHLLPQLDWTELSTVLFGLLGLSYHRTQEKTK